MTVNPEGETGESIVETIKNSNIETIKNSEIIQIISKETLISTIYEVETKGKDGQVQIITISVQPEQKPEIVQVQPTKPTTTTGSSTTTSTQETKTTKTVSEVTGETVTITTGGEVGELVEIFTPAIVKQIPEIAVLEPIFVETSDSGDVSWSTVIYSNETKTIQVTTTYDKTTETVKVVDSKEIQPIKPGAEIVPEVKVYHIPKVAIETTSTRKTELKQIVNEVKKTYKTGEIESVEIVNFGNVEKVSVIFNTGVKKIEIEYLANPKTKEVTLIETVQIPKDLTGQFFEEETNKYGEVTIISNNIKEIIVKVPESGICVEYVKEHYPVVVGKPVEAVKVTEFPDSYQVNYITKIDSTKSVTIVVEIDKVTKTVTEVSTYTKDQESKPIAPPAKPSVQQPIMCIRAPCSVENVKPESKEVENIVKYIETSPEIPVNKITKVITAEKTTTVFNSDVVKVIAVTDQGDQIETVVNYNPDTEEVYVNTIDVTQG